MNSTSNGCVIYNTANLDVFTNSSSVCASNTTDNSTSADVPLAILLTTVYVAYLVVGIIALIILVCVHCAVCYSIYKVLNQHKKINEEIDLNITKLNEKIKIIAARKQMGKNDRNST
jgi:hypothetical protein